MRHVLVEAGQRFGMIFVGYSGRDASIMEALTDVLNTPAPFPNGLYWLTSSAARLLPAVAEFLDRARAAGVDVAVVECATFDELAADLIKTTDLPQPLFDRVMEGRPSPRLVPVQLPTAEARPFPVLRYSALLIEKMPCTARRVKLAQHTTSPAVRELFKQKGVRATVAAQGRELAVFGKDQEIIPGGFTTASGPEPEAGLEGVPPMLGVDLSTEGGRAALAGRPAQSSVRLGQ